VSNAEFARGIRAAVRELRKNAEGCAGRTVDAGYCLSEAADSLERGLRKALGERDPSLLATIDAVDRRARFRLVPSEETP